ncbi:MAG: M66 family metalloprotease [Lewinella sp.]
MKVIRFLPLILMLCLFSCEQDEALLLTPAEDAESFAKLIETRSATDDFEVFFAQTHVLRPQDPYFGLVSDRPVLIKAHLTSETGEAAPEMLATLTLNGNTTTLELTGPAFLPPATDLSPGKVVHSFDDSYTKTIPKEWVQPGLEITIQAGDKQVQFTDLLIGAPNRIPITMLDAHFFVEGTGDYPSGWEEDMAAKLPMADFDLRRIPNVVFPEVSIAARHGQVRAVRTSSVEDYKTLTGVEFDNEQTTVSMWNKALHAAGGLITERGLFFTNTYNIETNGQGSHLNGLSNINKPGVFFHEFGHTMDLWHWGERGWDSKYPYREAMHGIAAPTKQRGVHAGPTWKYDLEKEEFISPIIDGGFGLRYKKDPMAGGGQADRAPGHLFSHFSDYSVDRARNFLQNKVAVWNESEGVYARWSQATGSYSKIIKHNNGVAFPQEPDTDVISIMASVSYATPEANLVYTPIGPYKGGIIKLFDAENADDRNEANRLYCKAGQCDVSVRVKQAHKEETTYIFPMRVNPSIGKKKWNSLLTRAINLRASDGEVTKVELLYTPRVEEVGLPAVPRILDTWEKE